MYALVTNDNDRFGTLHGSRAIGESPKALDDVKADEIGVDIDITPIP